MIKRYIWIVAIFFSINLNAQDNFYYSQYFQVGSTINPAMTGIDNFMDIKTNYRNQWNGFTDSPSSNYVGVNTYVKKNSEQAYREYTLRISDPSTIDSLSNIKTSLKSDLKHGLGGYILYDQQGPFQQITGAFNYAMHFPISFKTNLSIGVAAKLSNYRIDLEKILLRDPDNDDYYQQLLAQGGRNNYIDINPGIMIYHEKWYFSYAAQKAYRASLSSEELLSYNNSLDHNFMAGVRINIGGKTKLLPSGYYLLNEFNSFWEANAKIMFNEKTWFGASYRSTETLVFMAGLYINNLFNISYSYDYTISNISNYNNGSHEIHFGIMLNKKDLKSPYLW